MKLTDVEDEIRDVVNWVAVKKNEEAQDVTTRIEPKTAEELVAKLDALAVAVADVVCREEEKWKAKKAKKKPSKKIKKKAKKKRI